MNGSYVLVDQFLENPKFMNSSLSLANVFATKKKQIDYIWLLVSDIFTIVNTLLACILGLNLNYHYLLIENLRCCKILKNGSHLCSYLTGKFVLILYNI